MSFAQAESRGGSSRCRRGSRVSAGAAFTVIKTKQKADAEMENSRHAEAGEFGKRSFGHDVPGEWAVLKRMLFIPWQKTGRKHSSARSSDSAPQSELHPTLRGAGPAEPQVRERWAGFAEMFWVLSILKRAEKNGGKASRSCLTSVECLRDVFSPLGVVLGPPLCPAGHHV